MGDHRPLEGPLTVRALDDVSLTIKDGEYVAIIGPSGSGKSTLMNVLGCLDNPSSGKYFLNGKDVSTLRDDQLADERNKHIGFVFQRFNLMGRISAVRNVEMPARYGGLNSKVRHERAIAALTAVGLGNRAEHKPVELSGGQQQRVAIARALVNQPNFLLADEPTGALDSKTGREILDLFEKLHTERGITVLVVTHDPNVARRADRVISIRDGRIESDLATAPVVAGAAVGVAAGAANADTPLVERELAGVASPAGSARGIVTRPVEVNDQSMAPEHPLESGPAPRWPLKGPLTGREASRGQGVHTATYGRSMREALIPHMASDASSPDSASAVLNEPAHEQADVPKPKPAARLASAQVWKRGVLAIIIAMVANVALGLAGSTLITGASRLPMFAPQTIALITAGLGLASVGVFALINRIGKKPVPLFRWIAVGALVLSIAPNIAIIESPSLLRQIPPLLGGSTGQRVGAGQGQSGQNQQSSIASQTATNSTSTNRGSFAPGLGPLGAAFGGSSTANASGSTSSGAGFLTTPLIALMTLHLLAFAVIVSVLTRRIGSTSQSPQLHASGLT